MNYDLEAARLKKDWAENPRWKGIQRGYTAEDVVRLRGSVHIEHTLARRGAEKLWKLIHDEPFVNTLGALTGNQALQQVKAGLKAIYLSGWQGSRGRQHRRRDVSRPVALSGQLGAARRAPHQQRADACRSDSAHGSQG
jgi:isocitrate lyase